MLLQPCNREQKQLVASSLLYNRSKRQLYLLAISGAVESGNQLARFIGNTDFAVRQTFVVEHLMRLGIQIAFTFGLENI